MMFVDSVSFELVGPGKVMGDYFQTSHGVPVTEVSLVTGWEEQGQESVGSSNFGMYKTDRN